MEIKNKKIHTTYLNMCFELSKLSKCRKLQVGSMIVCNNKIISTGINGTIIGQQNCCDKFKDLSDDEFIDAHNGWSRNNEIHSEMNAIIFASKTTIEINDKCVIYCTHEPCDNCLKHIAACGIKTIYYKIKYKGNTDKNIFNLNIFQIN